MTADEQEWVPTTEEVREEWQYATQGTDYEGNVTFTFEQAGAQFDRWLAQHDAEQQRIGAVRALREAADGWYLDAPTDYRGVIDWLRDRADQTERGEGA